MSKRMYNYILDYHKKLFPDKFALLIRYSDYLSNILKIIAERRRKRRKKWLKIEIEYLKSNIITSFDGQIELIKTTNGYKVFSPQMTGCFRIWLDKEKDLVVHIIRTSLNKKMVVEYTCGTEESLIYLQKLIEDFVTVKRKSFKYTKGFFNFSYDHFNASLVYWRRKVDNLTLNCVESVLQKNIEADINFYFKNIDRFLKYGRHGLRKVLVTGPPGTGKTTAIINMLYKFSSNYITGVMVNSGTDVINGLSELIRKNHPMILLVEELDILKGMASGDLLNFLDGISSPATEKGCYIIFTTNYPKLIDKRITQRPGRIDRVFVAPFLTGYESAEIAQFYLPDNITLDQKQLAEALDKTTPAFVKEIVNMALYFAVEENIEVDIKHIRKARRILTESLKAGLTSSNQDMLSVENDYELNGPSPYIEYRNKLEGM